MSFRINESQQISLFDRTNKLTDRERKYLDKSWAKEFAEYIFPSINEKPFEVLYCEDNGRPNTPVNVIIGALILKEMSKLTDEELLESILLDSRYQYALHLTSYDEIPASDRSFSRFRERLYWHEVITGEDLLNDVVQDYSKVWAKRMKINGKLKRMDSLMVSTSSKNMGRLELIFTCTSNLVKLHIENDEGKLLPEHLLQYNSENKNSYCYRLEKEEVITKLEEVTADAILVYGLSELFSTTTQYIQMTRLLEEQTIDGRLKDKNQVSTTSMQNPSDEDATFRTKAGKDYKGYTLNIVEDCSEDINLITQYDYEANVHSDMDFAAELIEELGYQEEEVKVLADGAYASKDNFDTAKENNIELITTNLVGKKTPEIIADFKVEDDMIIECPEGHKPIDCKYKEKDESYRAHFDKETCEKCKNKDKCPLVLQKKTALIRFTKTAISRAEYSRKLSTEEYKEYARIRNAIEGVPSILRRRYGIDEMPVRGLVRSKMWVGFKIAAINTKRIIKRIKDEGNEGYNTLLSDTISRFWEDLYEFVIEMKYWMFQVRKA